MPSAVCSSRPLVFFLSYPGVWDESVCHASDGSFSLDTHDFVFDEIRERHGPKLLINRGTVIQFFYWTYELFVKQLAICQLLCGLNDGIAMMGLAMAQMAFNKSNWKTITHYHFRFKGHNLQIVSDFKDHRYHTQLHFVCIQYTYRSYPIIFEWQSSAGWQVARASNLSFEDAPVLGLVCRSEVYSWEHMESPEIRPAPKFFLLNSRYFYPFLMLRSHISSWVSRPLDPAPARIWTWTCESWVETSPGRNPRI